MRLLEPERLARLAVRQRRFELTHLAGDRRVRAELFQRLAGRDVERDRVVGRVEHLEAKAVLFETKPDDLAEIARVDVAPGVALAQRRVGEKARELPVLVRLDHVADAQRIDVRAVAHREGAGGLFVADLGQTIGIHRIDVVVLFERE